MFSFFDLLRELSHISEITGLSIGVLAVLIVLGWTVPTLRGLAICIGVTALVSYFVAIYEYRLGRADVQKDWAAANKAADKLEADHDKEVAARIKAQYQPQIAALRKQLADFNARAAHVPKYYTACPVGDFPLSLRHNGQ